MKHLMIVRTFRTGALSALAAFLLAGCPAQDGVRYFEVAERTASHGDSYVLPLSAEADIAHARDLIAHPEAAGATIPVATIARGGSGGAYVNRNVAGDGAAWSWRVTAFEGFADNTAEILDSWPGYVEDHYDDYVASSGGRIGFWNYTVVREVSSVELAAAGAHWELEYYLGLLFPAPGLVY